MTWVPNSELLIIHNIQCSVYTVQYTVYSPEIKKNARAKIPEKSAQKRKKEWTRSSTIGKNQVLMPDFCFCFCFFFDFLMLLQSFVSLEMLLLRETFYRCGEICGWPKWSKTFTSISNGVMNGMVYYHQWKRNWNSIFFY